MANQDKHNQAPQLKDDYPILSDTELAAPAAVQAVPDNIDPRVAPLVERVEATLLDQADGNVGESSAEGSDGQASSWDALSDEARKLKFLDSER